MKKLWYKIVRFYVYLGLHAFFKEISKFEAEKIPKKGAYLFVANHRNGLIDPILIAITQANIFHFLTRASAFKNPIANFLLRSINMLPIYRIRDGKNSIQKNQKIFEACYNAFDQKESVLIFPEGNHGLPRRVRPLSKGFTRIAFGYLNQNPKNILQIIPVGINYANMQQKGSRVRLYYGKPIYVREYYQPDNEKEAIEQLKNKVYSNLKQLTTHIDSLEQHEQIEKILISKGIDFLDPTKSNEEISKIVSMDHPILPEKNKKNLLQLFLSTLFVINTFIPIYIWHKYKKKVKDIVLKNTFLFGISIALIPLVYCLQAAVISYFTNYVYGISYLLVSIVLLFMYKNTLYTDNFTT